MNENLSLSFEKVQEELARKRCKAVEADPKLLSEKAPKCNPRDLGSVAQEAAWHLGNRYFCEIVLPITGDLKDKTELELKARSCRKAHDELMDVAGKLLADRTQHTPENVIKLRSLK